MAKRIHSESPRLTPLRHNVQRDVAFSLLVVDFRNAVERMQIRLGRTLDTDHLWWGFGPGLPPIDDGGLAGSRVPRYPPDGAGGAAVELEEPDKRETIPQA